MLTLPFQRISSTPFFHVPLTVVFTRYFSVDFLRVFVVSSVDIFVKRRAGRGRTSAGAAQGKGGDMKNENGEIIALSFHEHSQNKEESAIKALVSDETEFKTNTATHLLANLLPNDPRHLIAIQLDDRILDDNLATACHRAISNERGLFPSQSVARTRRHVAKDRQA